MSGCRAPRSCATRSRRSSLASMSRSFAITAWRSKVIARTRSSGLNLIPKRWCAACKTLSRRTTKAIKKARSKSRSPSFVLSNLAGFLARLGSLELGLECRFVYWLFVQQQLRGFQVCVGVEPVLDDVVVEEIQHCEQRHALMVSHPFLYQLRRPGRFLV